MSLEPLGDGAWRIELPADLDRAAALEALRTWPRVLDVVVADRHAAIRFDPEAPPDDPRPMLARAPRHTVREARVHVIRARYDGPDLDEVAHAIGRTREETIALHAREYDVEMVGFLPGFAYLGPLDPAFTVARRATPRPRVPALSIGIAAGRTGIYPFASPGGWFLLGRALDFTPFDTTSGARLRLGDRVRFEPVP